MDNIVLFISSVAIYLVVWSAMMVVLDVFSVPVPSPSLKLYAKAMGIIALLCLPVNIGGNVFTIAGNAVAEKSVYSVFSAYQIASGNTFAVFNVGYQKAGVTAFSVLGLDYQRAGEDADNILGLGVQYVGRDANVGVGLAPYQRAQRTSETVAGLSVYQQGGRSAQTLLGVGLYQQVPGKDRAFGFLSELKADDE